MSLILYVDPEQNLELELSEGSAKKRKYDVSLKFVKAIKSDEGGELVYLIDFKPMELSDKFKKKEKEEEFVDEYEKPEEEDNFIDEPNVSDIKMGGKLTGNLRKLDTHFRSDIIIDDDDEDNFVPEPRREIVKRIMTNIPKPPREIVKKPIINREEPVKKPLISTSSIKDMIIDTILSNLKRKNLNKREILDLLLDKLPDDMYPTQVQKISKIENTMHSDLYKKGLVKNIGTIRYPVYTLVKERK